MFKGMTGRLHALIIVIILAMSGICAIAEFDASVNVSKMTVYASASSSAKTLAQLSSGAELTVTKIDGRWAKIEYKGKTGYCELKLLTTQSDSARYVIKNLTVYVSDSSSSTKVGTLKVGEKVYYVADAGNKEYVLVQNSKNGRLGYVVKSSISKDKPTEQKAEAVAIREYLYAAEKVSVYASASASSKKLGTINAGEKVGLIEENGDYLRVQNLSNKACGYVLKASMSKTEPQKETPKESAKKMNGYVYAVQKTTIYRSASTASKKLGTLSADEKVGFVEETGNFLCVQNLKNQCFAYVLKADMTTVSPEEAKKAAAQEEKSVVCPAYATSKASVYASASTSSKKLGTISAGAKVGFVEQKGDFLYVKNLSNGLYGYVLSNCMSKTDPAEAEAAKKAEEEAKKKAEAEAAAKKAEEEAKKKAEAEAAAKKAEEEAKKKAEAEAAAKKAEEEAKKKAEAEAAAKKAEEEAKKKENTVSIDKSKVTKTDWFDGGSSILSKGSYGYLYDVDTGTVIKIKRKGGTNHADVEPATAEDTAKMLKLYGEWSWASRAVILVVGNHYEAAAMNGMPHGDSTITDNNFDGHFCVHLLNSRTHGTDSVNETHQASIAKAYRWAHG